jgi:hypothetical protein
MKVQTAQIHWKRRAISLNSRIFVLPSCSIGKFLLPERLFCFQHR